MCLNMCFDMLYEKLLHAVVMLGVQRRAAAQGAAAWEFMRVPISTSLSAPASFERLRFI